MRDELESLAMMKISLDTVGRHVGNALLEAAVWALSARVWNAVCPLFALSVGGTFIYCLGAALGRPVLHSFAEDVLPKWERKIGRWDVSVAQLAAIPASSCLGARLALLAGYALAMPVWQMFTYASFWALVIAKAWQYRPHRAALNPVSDPSSPLSARP